MSYEGYHQLLCKNGHYDVYDAYESAPPHCRFCKAGWAWQNSVDETNGSYCMKPTTYDEDGYPEVGEICDGCECCDNGRIDGYVELEVVSNPGPCVCTSCGNKHSAGPTVFKIPKDK